MEDEGTTYKDELRALARDVQMFLEVNAGRRVAYPPEMRQRIIDAKLRGASYRKLARMLSLPEKTIEGMVRREREKSSKPKSLTDSPAVLDAEAQDLADALRSFRAGLSTLEGFTYPDDLRQWCVDAMARGIAGTTVARMAGIPSGAFYGIVSRRKAISQRLADGHPPEAKRATAESTLLAPAPRTTPDAVGGAAAKNHAGRYGETEKTSRVAAVNAKALLRSCELAVTNLRRALADHESGELGGEGLFRAAGSEGRRLADDGLAVLASFFDSQTSTVCEAGTTTTN